MSSQYALHIHTQFQSAIKYQTIVLKIFNVQMQIRLRSGMVNSINTYLRPQIHPHNRNIEP